MAGGASGSNAPTIVRGSPTRMTEMMESFQEAYLRGVAAAAGCVISGKPEIDEGVDVSLTHRADVHLQGDKTAHLQIQMKSSADGPIDNGNFVSASLRRSRYDDFRALEVTINKIVVILHMPAEQEDWLRVGDEAVWLHHRAYWVNIQGLPSMSDENQSITVKAPTVQVFDDIALCQMMQRIGQWGKP